MEELTNWISENTDTIIFIGLILILVISLITIISYFSNKAVVLRTLRKKKKTAISSLQEGQIAKVIGKAKSISEGLSAPLSGRKCVYYKIEVQEKRGGKNRHWHTIINDEKAQDFIVESYAGKAIVKMYSYKGYFLEDKKYKSGFFEDTTLKLENYLEKHGKKSLSILGFNKTMRFKEAIIAIDEEIAVMGMVKYQDSSQYGIKSSYSKLPVLQEEAKTQLFISDDPKALEENGVK